MHILRTALLVFFIPAVAVAQTLPATHAYSGFDAASARTRLERDGHRPYGPKFEAAAMPGATEIRVVKPAFRLPEENLGIADTHDVLFFAESRLVRMRVHLKAGGEPLAKHWTSQ